MSCLDYVYSEEYSDFIVDYNYNLNEINDKFNPDCVNVLSTRYAIVHKKIEDFQEMSINRYGYSTFPKIYTQLDDLALDSLGVSRLRRLDNFSLTGRDVLIGFIDSGINYTLDAFKNEDNTSRIMAIWDQSEYKEGENSYFNYGRYYTREEINEAISSTNPYEYIKELDTDGHGTKLSALAAGAVDEENDFSGVAIDSELVVVKLKEAKKSLKDYYGIEENIRCYQETDIMAGILFLEEIARRENKPMVICIGIGSNQGGHEGRSYVGELLDFLSSSPGFAIVIAGGNEVTSKHHYRGNITLEDEVNMNENIDNIEINVSEGIKGFYLELWTQAPNMVGVGFTSPRGEITPMINYVNNNDEEVLFLFDNTRVYVNYVNYVSNSGNALVFIRFKNPSEGVWSIQVYKNVRVEGRYDAWLPMKGLISQRLEIINSEADTTLSSIANASYVLTICGYDYISQGLYVNSSRGYTVDERIKPDLVAPSVEVKTVNNRGDYTTITGTSAAAALTTGVVAMLFQWAISDNNYREMDGLIAKRLLIRGAKQDLDISYPNKEWGYGKVDIYETFNSLRNL